MAKRRKEQRPPITLPPAKLFLDDLEELARIFMEARIKQGDPLEEGERAPKISYHVGDWECDAIQDLKDLGRNKEYFEMRQDEPAGRSIYIYVAGRTFAWGSFGFPPEGEWALYGQILELARKRKMIMWYPWRRPTVVIFQNSFEYSGLSASIKRHGSQVAIAVLSSIATLIAVGAARVIWQYFHHL
jgi:hypothetical protein